jgi:hypothetical protein
MMERTFTSDTGAGGYRVELQVESLEAAWEHPVSGELRLYGDEVIRAVKSAGVRLFTPVDDPEVPVIMDSTCWADIALQPTDPRIVRFQVLMSWGAAFRPAAELRLEVEWDGGVPATQLGVPIQVLPPREFALIARVAAEEGGFTVRDWAAPEPGGGAYAYFDVPPERRKVFDGLMLWCRRGDGYVYGTAYVDPHARTIRERLRAAVGPDVRMESFHLPSGDEEAARAYFTRLLRPHGDATRQHPIPSRSGDGTSGALPLPSEEAGSNS